jgi:hypothetical protein
VSTYKDLVDARAKSVSNRQKVRDIQHRLSLEEVNHTVTKTQSTEEGMMGDAEELWERLKSTKEACQACELAENKLLEGYQTSLHDLHLHDKYATQLNFILAAKADYQEELGEFDKQPLLQAIATFKGEVEDFSPLSAEPLEAKDFTGRVATLNEAAAEIKKLKGAWDKAVEDGKSQCGGLECTQEGLAEMGVDEGMLEKLREERDIACADIPTDGGSTAASPNALAANGPKDEWPDKCPDIAKKGLCYNYESYTQHCLLSCPYVDDPAMAEKCKAIKEANACDTNDDYKKHCLESCPK